MSDAKHKSYETRQEWLEAHLLEHRDASAFEVIGAYQDSGLGESLGGLSLDEVLRTQASLGVGGMTHERLAEQRQRGAQRRAILERQVAGFLRMSTDDLRDLPDTMLKRAVLARLGARREAAESGNGTLSDVGGRVWAVCMLDSEVKNGGFDQLFRNGFVEVALARDALIEMELSQAAQVVDAALALVHRKYPTGMRAAASARDEELSVLDRSYYDALGAPNDVFTMHVVALMRKHLDQL